MVQCKNKGLPPDCHPFFTSPLRNRFDCQESSADSVRLPPIASINSHFLFQNGSVFDFEGGSEWSRRSRWPRVSQKHGAFYIVAYFFYFSSIFSLAPISGFFWFSSYFKSFPEVKLIIWSRCCVFLNDPDSRQSVFINYWSLTSFAY